MEIFLVKSERKILRILHSKALSKQELAHRVKVKYPWMIDHYIESLETDYQLIEEITYEECAAFHQGKDHLSLSPHHPAAMSGKYILSRAGFIVLEQLNEQRRSGMKEWSIAIASAIIGGLTGFLASFVR